jgi:hypothetical protein
MVHVNAQPGINTDRVCVALNPDIAFGQSISAEAQQAQRQQMQKGCSFGACSQRAPCCAPCAASIPPCESVAHI